MLSRRSLLSFIGCGSSALPLAALAKVIPSVTSPPKEKQYLLILLSHVAGFNHYQQPTLLCNMEPGEVLILQREASNPSDVNAIEVYWHNEKIGYVPRVNNAALSLLMDDGVPLQGEIAWLADHPWQPVGLAVNVIQ